jgi:hypothetical protein
MCVYLNDEIQVEARVAYFKVLYYSIIAGGTKKNKISEDPHDGRHWSCLCSCCKKFTEFYHVREILGDLNCSLYGFDLVSGLPVFFFAWLLRKFGTTHRTAWGVIAKRPQ